MDDALTLIAEDTSCLLRTWREGSRKTSRDLARRLAGRAGTNYPAIASAATHWLRLTATLVADDPVRCDAALALLVSAVRRAQTVTGA